MGRSSQNRGAGGEAHIYGLVDLQGKVIVTEPTDLPLPEVTQGGEVDGVYENF